MNRGDFIVASVALLSPGGTVKPEGGSHFVERRADFDIDRFSNAVNRNADIRQVFEVASFHPQILNNVKNSLNGLQFGFGYVAPKISIVLAPHGPSNALTYNDSIWGKYRLGEALNLRDASGALYSKNTFVVPSNAFNASLDPDEHNGFYQDISLQTLQRRGVIVLTCHTAVEEQARTLVSHGFAPAGASPQDVADDILSNLITGAVVVPSMVAAIAVLQARYKYVYTAVAF